MKTKNLFLVTMVLLVGVVLESSSQTYSVPATAATGGIDNINIGTNSGSNSTTGNYFNISIGKSSSNPFSTGGGNCFLGVNTGINNTSGNNNSFIGQGVGQNNTTGTANVFIGGNSGGLGPTAGKNTTGNDNVIIGSEAGQNNTTGSSNLFLGQKAGRRNISGNSNTFLGVNSGQINESGNDNISVGASGPESGNNNIVIGKSAGGTLTGSDNLMIGIKCGELISSGTGSATNITGTRNTYLGYVQVPNSPKSATFNGFDSNAMIILADGGGNQRLLINNNGYAGIGLGSNNIPQNALELKGGVAGTSGLRFRSYTDAINPTTSSSKFLTVNSNGDVVLKNLAPIASSTNGAYWGLTGNAGTTAGTNFLGTTDNVDLVFKRNNAESGRIGTSNTSFGYSSKNVGSNNINMGVFSGSTSTDINNNYNISIGTLAGSSTSLAGFSNIFLGHRTGLSTTTGKENVFIGYQTGYNNSTGKGNTFIGNTSGVGNTTTDSNIAIGNTSGGAGTSNISIGTASGYGNSGTKNIFIGEESGYYNPGAITSGNVFIGYRAGKNFNANDKLIISGNSIQNLIEGDFVNRDLKFNVNDGVGPFTSFLELTGNGNASGLRFTNLTSGTNATTNLTNKVLSVNSTGDVILVNDVTGTGGSTLIQPGTNVSITGTGVVGNPYIINSTAANCNLYSCDDTITTTTGLRTVTMGNNNLFFNTTGSNFTDGTSGSGRIYIGNNTLFPNLVSLPLGSESQYRLLVEGGILTEKVKVALRNTGNWMDGVFANDYKLMPLKEVETFVTENKHLPGIESAADLVKNGLDLADMQAKQMGKIEELTLYVIEQNKQFEKQSKEVEELKAQVKALLDRK